MTKIYDCDRDCDDETNMWCQAHAYLLQYVKQDGYFH